MNTTSNIDNATKILRDTLIEQSQLLPERVLNSLSIHGTELDKILEEQIYNSIELNDTTMLFELYSLDSTSNVSMEEGDIYTAKPLTCSNSTICSEEVICGKFIIDRSITYYKMFRLHLILYGQNSSDLAVKLSSRLRSLSTRSKLYESGIYIEKVSDPETINEYKNDIMWLRNDVNIDLGLKFSISQVSLPTEYMKLNDIHVIRRKNI